MAKSASNNKHKILKCSIRLFAQQGFSGTSIRQIAQNASTTIPNIYYYFENKESLYSHVLETAIDAFTQKVQSAALKKASLREQLIAMTKAKYSFISEHPELMQIFFREWFAHEGRTVDKEETQTAILQSLAKMAYMVRDKIAKGEIRKVNPEHAAWFLVGVFNAFDVGFINLGLTPSEEEIEAVVDLALAGLANNKRS